MGNITLLSQGNLEGLKKQVCECIDHAHEQGYKKGKNEPRKVTNVEDTNEYQIGYKVGYADGKKQAISEDKENEMYNKGIEDASNLLAFVSRDFMQECFPNENGWDLFDLNAKYGLAVIIKEFKKWQEEKAEEEWKIGDELYSETTNSHAIIVRVNAWNSYECFNDNGIFKITDELKKYWVKIEHFAEVSQLLNKLKGDKE